MRSHPSGTVSHMMYRIVETEMVIFSFAESMLDNFTVYLVSNLACDPQDNARGSLAVASESVSEASKLLRMVMKPFAECAAEELTLRYRRWSSTKVQGLSDPVVCKWKCHRSTIKLPPDNGHHPQ